MIQPTADALIERANAIHRQVPLIDGHNDLPWKLRQQAAGDLARADFRQSLPQCHTDLPRLRSGGVGGVFFAAYVPASYAQQGIAARATIEQIDLIHRMVDHAPDSLELATTAGDIERIHRAGKIAAMIGVEGGHSIENSLALLRQFHALGVRYMTLAYETTDWSDGCPPAPARHNGLAPFGVEVVREMNRLGMLVDLSHCSDDTMRDAIEASDAPVIFSHSSARALAPGEARDVPDDVLRMVHGNGGVVMVNFFSGFLLAETADGREKWRDARDRIDREYPDEDQRRAAWRAWMRDNPMPRGTVATVADHIEHIRKIAGIDHVGIGSDFDGVSMLPEGLDDVSCFPNLTAELLRRGYSDDDVKNVLGLNVLRVMREAEEVSRQIRKERTPSMATTQPATLLRDLPTKPTTATTSRAARSPRDPASPRALPPSRPAAAR
jgi:membrane dipeptidase